MYDYGVPIQGFIKLITLLATSHHLLGEGSRSCCLARAQVAHSSSNMYAREYPTKEKFHKVAVMKHPLTRDTSDPLAATTKAPSNIRMCMYMD